MPLQFYIPQRRRAVRRTDAFSKSTLRRTSFLAALIGSASNVRSRALSHLAGDGLVADYVADTQNAPSVIALLYRAAVVAVRTRRKGGLRLRRGFAITTADGGYRRLTEAQEGTAMIAQAQRAALAIFGGLLLIVIAMPLFKATIRSPPPMPTMLYAQDLPLLPLFGLALLIRHRAQRPPSL